MYKHSDELSNMSLRETDDKLSKFTLMLTI